MASVSTLKNIYDTLIKQTGWGLVIPSFTGTTTTLTLTTTGSSELRGPFTGKKIPIGSPVIITAGGTPLEDTYVSDWNPSTGVITVSPAITTGSTDGIIITNDSIKHGDRLIEAVNRAMDNHITRWQKTPLTFVPDGDLRGTTVTDYWTAAANGTAAYVAAQVFPAGSAADEAGAVGLNRVLQLTSTGATSVTGNGIRAQHSTQQKSWYFLTAIRLVSGTGTATFSVRDNTNSADITLNVTRGNDSNTLTTTTFGDFMVCEGMFQQPTTCDEVAPRLTLSATTMVAQMAPVIMFPVQAMSFPIPNRITSKDYLGNYYEGTVLAGPGGLENIASSEPVTVGGLTHGYNNNGDHLTVNFNFMPQHALWYDELVSEAEFTAITGTTTFPLAHVVKWAKFELLNAMWESEDPKFIPYGTRSVPEPSRWLSRRNAALRSALGSEFEPELINVRGRV